MARQLSRGIQPSGHLQSPNRLDQYLAMWCRKSSCIGHIKKFKRWWTSSTPNLFREMGARKNFTKIQPLSRNSRSGLEITDGSKAGRSRRRATSTVADAGRSSRRATSTADTARRIFSFCFILHR